jgi:AmmeMemoRadiSam system protein A
MVAAVDILEDEDGRTHVEAEPARAEPAEAALHDIVAAAGPKHPLVRLARDAVEAFVRERRVLVPPSSLESPPARAGCFVSLKTDDGVLRGCIGSVQPQEPDLPREVVRNAIDAATTDLRFLPVNAEELPSLVYSVDVLTDPELIEGLQELDPKRFGVIVQNGRRRGLLLPDIEGVDSAEQQVAIAKGKALIEPHEPVSLWRFEVRRLT